MAEREGCDDLVNALAKLSLPDTDAMEWRTKAAVMNTPQPTTVCQILNSTCFL